MIRKQEVSSFAVTFLFWFLIISCPGRGSRRPSCRVQDLILVLAYKSLDCRREALCAYNLYISIRD